MIIRQPAFPHAHQAVVTRTRPGVGSSRALLITGYALAVIGVVFLLIRGIGAGADEPSDKGPQDGPVRIVGDLGAPGGSVNPIADLVASSERTGT
jgi:hypothetical protein